MCKNRRIWRWVDHTVGHSTLSGFFIPFISYVFLYIFVPIEEILMKDTRCNDTKLYARYMCQCVFFYYYYKWLLFIIIFTDQLAGRRRSLIFFRSSIQSRCGNISRACWMKYGNMSSTWPGRGAQRNWSTRSTSSKEAMTIEKPTNNIDLFYLLFQQSMYLFSADDLNYKTQLSILI